MFLTRCLFVLSCVSLLAVNPATASEIDFVRDIRPILAENCFNCHGPDANTREADLRLDLADDARRVLQSDSQEEASELLQRINSDDADLVMPPPASKKELNDAQRELLRQWVAAGAKYEEHWSFRRIQRPIVPPASLSSDDVLRVKNPIDSFIRERHQREGLEFQSLAAPRTLLRRVTLDLTGEPPSLDECRSFLDDVAALSLDVAYSRLIDRLMHSPRYGEHMALAWLEAARYADTDGYQNDRYRYQSAWRDWVLRAFNENMPYDQFIVEQLAGDLLPDATLWQQVATGFGRNHRINSEDGSIPEEWRTENVVDRVDTLGTVFLGLTIGCARCHDHKYDPISQRDYYQLFAYFNSIAEHGVGPNNGNSPPFIALPDTWPLVAPEENHLLTPQPVELRRAREEAGNGLLRPQAGEPNTVMVMHELAQPRPTYLLVRGQYDVPDTEHPLLPNVPQALAFAPDKTPSNRLELARWLVHPNHPLTARVAVNRLWQQIFGMGLVESSENFGTQGTLPSHPELLDWLAIELIESGWDLRYIQKQILLSATYRQSSAAPAELVQRDPKNQWLARGPRVRLPAFAIRDSALAASGLLVNTIGGPSVKPYMPPSVWSSISNNKYEQGAGEDLFRRSLYTYWRRTIPPPTMVNFNAATREVCSVRNDPTNTPLQALTLLNNKIFVEAARCLAERVLECHADSLDDRLRSGFEMVLTRLPNVEELQLLREAYESALAEYTANPKQAQKLLNLGESPRNTQLDSAEHAAMTVVASLILNLDEAIHKE